MSTQRQIPPTLSTDALLAKSQKFIADGLAARNSQDESAYPLAAAIALELLAKAALASQHPSLIVDTKRNENTLLVAAGFPVETRVATISAETAYARMKHLNSRFTESVRESCVKLAGARNAHLHSGELPFAGGGHQRWEPDFWYAVEVILETVGKTFEDWLGTEGATLSKSVLDNARAARKAATSTKLMHYKAHFLVLHPKSKEQKEAIAKSDSLDPDEIGRSNLRRRYDEYWLIECPACEARGIAGGDHAETLLSEDQDGMDFGFERVLEVYQADEFYCPTCGIHLSSDDEIFFAGMDGAHDVESEREIEWEPDYGND